MRESVNTHNLFTYFVSNIHVRIKGFFSLMLFIPVAIVQKKWVDHFFEILIKRNSASFIPELQHYIIQ